MECVKHPVTGQLKHGTTDVLDAFQCFYQKLFECKHTDAELAEKTLGASPTLSNNDSNSCESEITVGELRKSLWSFGNGKSPGPDGFTVAFWKRLWKHLGKHLHAAALCSHDNASLSPLMALGYITVLHKKKDKDMIANYRPISLLCVHYKVITKCLSNRLSKVMHSIIDASQTGFLPDRYIGENIRLMLDLVQYCEQTNTAAYALLIDMEKAYDRVSWVYLHQCVKAAGFGPYIAKWMQTLYPLNAEDQTKVHGRVLYDVHAQTIQRRIVVNGELSPLVTLKCGVAQGDPLSYLLYILCDESKHIMLRMHSHLHGIPLPARAGRGGRTAVSSGFADDTAVYMTTMHEMSIVQSILDAFCNISGQKVNWSKCMALALGPASTERPPGQCPFEFLKGGVAERYLGAQVGTQLDLTFMWQGDQQSPGITMKAANRANAWGKHHLSLIGRVMVAKACISSVASFHHMTMGMPEAALKELNAVVWKFMWNSHTTAGCCSQDVASTSYQAGGIRAMQVIPHHHALLCKWPLWLLDSKDGAWKDLAWFWLCKVGERWRLGEHILLANPTPQLIRALNTAHIPVFWKQVLLAFWKLKPMRVVAPTCKEQVLAQPINFNRHILNAVGKPYCMGGWLNGDDGWYTLKDLWDEPTGTWYTTEQAMGWLPRGQARLVQVVVNSIPPLWRELVQSAHTRHQFTLGDWVVLNSDSDDQPLGLVVKALPHEVHVHVHEWGLLHEQAHPTKQHEVWEVDGDLVKMYVQTYNPAISKSAKHTVASHVVRGRMDECPTMPECFGWGTASQGKTLLKLTVRQGRALIQGHCNTPPSCQARWELRHSHLEFDWGAIWSNIWHYLTPNKLSAHLWKALHMFGRDSFMCRAAECHLCTHPQSRGLMLMGGTHATWQCPKAHRVWRWLSKQWATLTGEHISLRDTVTLYTGLANTAFPHQWRLFYQATHYFTWLAWCKWAHEQIKYSHHTISAMVVAYIGDHITALHHNASATMDHGKAARLFCETWCDPACMVCDVRGGKVVMYYKL